MTATGSATAERPSLRSIALRFAVEPSPRLIFVLVVLIAGFAVASPFFLTVENALNIGRAVAMTGAAAAGVTVALAAGGLDLSSTSMMIVAAWVAGTVSNSGVNIAIAVLAGISAGALLGAINGVISVGLGVDPLITTLGTLVVFEGISFLLVGGTSLYVPDQGYAVFGRGFVIGRFPVSVLILVLVFILSDIILRRMSLGRSIYLAGGNGVAARLAGIPVARITIATLAFSGAMAAIGGIIFTSVGGYVVPGATTDYALDIIAAVVLGGASLSGGKGTMVGTLLGVLVLGTVTNGLNLLGVSSFWQMVVRGGIVVLALVMDRTLARRTQ